jgi:hypothetical protein
MRTDYQLGKTIVEALRLRDLMRAEGATKADLDAAMLKTVKAAWPTVTEEDDRRCACGDTGAVIHTCPGHRRCPVSQHPRHGPHTYLTPCSCSEGTRFIPPARTVGEVEVKARRGMRRLGR